jgi:hypothetical protein
MNDDRGLSLRVSADAGDLYATVFALGFVGLLTGVVLLATGVGSPAVSVPVLAVLAVTVAAIGAALYATVE